MFNTLMKYEFRISLIPRRGKGRIFLFAHLFFLCPFFLALQANESVIVIAGDYQENAMDFKELDFFFFPLILCNSLSQCAVHVGKWKVWGNGFLC